MPKLPRVTANDLLRALRRDGWVEVGRAGSHVQLKHPNRHGKVTIPMHTNKIIPAFVLASVLKQAGMTADELRGLL